MLLTAGSGWTRTPEVAPDAREGIWFAAGDSFVHQTRDGWSVFPAGAAVNALATDNLTLWLATDEGVVRFETASRSHTRLGLDDGLPSESASAIAVDGAYVWIGTNKGLTRYRKLDRTLRVYTDETGLPHRAVTDIATVGDTVWIATRGGLAVYDPQSDGLRAYGTADGLASDFIEELYVFRDEVWCRTDAGLSRFRPAVRRFTNFGPEDLGGRAIRTFAADGDRLWIGTDAGLVFFDAASEAFATFAQQSALEGRAVLGVEPFTDYLFITTDVEVVQYHKLNRSFRRFTEADGLRREAGARGTVLSGGQLTLLFADGASVLDIQRDLWTYRTLAPTVVAKDGGGASWRLWGTVDAESPRDLRAGTEAPGGYGTVRGGGGAGTEWDDGRVLDASALVDYGELELPGVRDVQVAAEYRGRDQHIVREIRAGDRLSYRGIEEGIEGPLLLAGAHTRLASPGASPTLSFSADGGVRRGVAVHDFLQGPRQEVYNLSQRYVLPGSERVYVDGELLTPGVDYTIIYPAGQLAFLDPERVDDLSVIEVQYEYDVLPKKGLGVVSLLDLLPADSEVGAWTRAGEPRVVSEESGLYMQIDGAAPKYIDRGWVRSVFAEYRQGSRTLQVWIHDMGTAAQAEDLFALDQPPARESVGGRDDVVLDIGLSTSYAVKAHSAGFYIELAIDEKSDVAKQSLKLFALQVLNRGENAGKHQVDVARESLVASRVAVSPLDGLELGGRFVQVQSLPNEAPGAPARRLAASTIDGRYERDLDRGGLLTAYAEAGASRDLEGGGGDGYAALGRLRISHPWIEGSASARYYDPHYVPLGSSDTLYGRLRDELRLDGTLYPARWLPVAASVVRQSAHPQEGGDGGLVQHATARLSLAHADLPAASVLVGHSLLDDGLSAQTTRLKLAGQADYDLAEGLLRPLGLKRFLVRGLYGVSDATTLGDGFFARGDRVTTSRVEAKLSPTATESTYALFRSRTTRGRTAQDGALVLASRHWELNAGARSAFIPGLIPQVSQSVLFDDAPNETGVRVRSANVSSAAQLGIYPGEWLAALTPVAVDTRYSYATESRAAANLKVLDHRRHRLDNRMSYNGMGRWELALQEAYEVALAGPAQERDAERLEVRNRVVFRPVHPSPITLRVDYVRERARNDPTELPGAPAWGRHETYEGALTWLMRWNPRVSTKLEGAYSLDDVRERVEAASGGTPARIVTGRQHQVRPELEFRYLLQGESSSLFIVQRDRAFRTFAAPGTGDSHGIDVGVGIIWSYADNVYLDGELAYRETWCLGEPCTPTRLAVPRLLLTAKL